MVYGEGVTLGLGVGRAAGVGDGLTIALGVGRAIAVGVGFTIAAGVGRVIPLTRRPPQRRWRGALVSRP